MVTGWRKVVKGAKRGKMATYRFPATLGARLMAGQRTLTPYVEVRILRPQPSPH
jgi:hypothetical protein